MSLETTDDTWTDRLARPAVALDLVLVVGFVALAVGLLFRPGVYRTPVAAALGIPLLLFVPGYALVSFLFPATTPDDAAADRTLAGMARHGHGLGGVERIALGFGTSVAFLPVLGVALAASPWAIGPATVLLSVSGFAVACAVGAMVRRLRRPVDRRFSLPLRTWSASVRGLRRQSLGDVVLNLGLAAAVVVALAAVGFAVAAPGPDQSYTDVYLLSQNETGELVAQGYPEEFTRGESKPIVVGLDNDEGDRTRYTVVVELQRIQQASNGGANVVEERQLARFTPTVEDGDSWQTRHDVTPSMTGENLRLTYLVYRGEPPENPTTENAYEHVHVWVNVTA